MSSQTLIGALILCLSLVSCGAQPSGSAPALAALPAGGGADPTFNSPAGAASASKAAAQAKRAAADSPDGDEAAVADAFHSLYHSSDRRTWKDTYWMGIGILKNPLDLWIYQETLYQVRPDVVIEAGTASGGSALFMAHLFDILGKGKVVTVDIEPGDALSGEHSSLEPSSRSRPQHPRITYITGSTTDPSIQAKVRAEVPRGAVVLVILDSDHHKEHVLAEMQAYADLVTPGSYLIVEDTNLGGHPVCAGFAPGPMGAVEAFLETRDDFSPDPSKEKFFFSFNPRGFLRRAPTTLAE